MDGFCFSTDLRVRFNETDAQGVVHNSAYLVWLEIARIDIERTSAPEALVAEAWTAHACVDASTLRPMRMPAWLAETLAGFEG